jgi:NADPH:quinone reductase-like Zn-dependent oxidoreductase
MASFRRRILWALLGLFAIAVIALAYLLGHEKACEPGPALAPEAVTMKAIVRRCYGPPEVLALEDIEKPVPTKGQVLVRVRAAGLNPLDWHYMRGEPYLMRVESGFGAPKSPRLGVDFAGVVEAVGPGVTKFTAGDAVFGGKFGALAQYVAVAEDGSIARMPANVDFEQAAGVNVAAVTALQALRDRADVRAGQSVLINGASGGVGSFAVQIAKSMGAVVTGVSSTRNQELVLSLGADDGIDYTTTDFTRGGRRYDVVIDNVANRGILEVRRVLAPEGKHLLIGGGGPDANPWFGAFAAPLRAMFVSWFVDQDIGMFLSHGSGEDLAALASLLQSGAIRTVIDRRYPLAETAEAMRYLETGRARGKVIVTMP